MIRLSFFGIFIALSLVSTVWAEDSTKVVKKLRDKEQFIAGVIIIQRSSIMRDSSKLHYYFDELMKVTGIGYEEGEKIIASYRSSPEKWEATLKRIDGYLLQLLEQRRDSLEQVLQKEKKDTLHE